MSQKHRRRKLTIAIMILVVIGFYSLILCPQFLLGSHPKQELKQASTPVRTIYKTIYSSDDSNSLIGFELHSNLQQCRFNTHKECSVIVKTMDPRSDDYKTYCKDIVNDVIGMYGDTNITINIYDSFEAYSVAVNDDFTITPEDAAKINTHKIAVFDSYEEVDDKYAYLTYYPDANNGLYERISYGIPSPR